MNNIILMALATGWVPTEPVEASIYWLNMLEVGFYLHCLYAMVFLEPMREDFGVMMLHHVVAILGLLSSYTFRYIAKQLAVKLTLNAVLIDGLVEWSQMFQILTSNIFTLLHK